MKEQKKLEEKFNATDNILLKTKYWTWILRESHPTLGSSILLLNRECYELSKISEDEVLDYKQIVFKIETVLKSLFDYSQINYFQLMMVDKNLHIHIIPRYSFEVEFGGKLWIDNYFPGLPDLSSEFTSRGELSLIKEVIIKKLEDVKK